ADATWGTGTLQEIDHTPLLESITVSAATAHSLTAIAPMVDAAFTAANSPHRGPAFLDIPMDVFFDNGPLADIETGRAPQVEPDPDDIHRIAALLAGAQRPVLVLGSDVWTDGAEHAARRFAEETSVPTIANGMGR